MKKAIIYILLISSLFIIMNLGNSKPKDHDENIVLHDQLPLHISKLILEHKIRTVIKSRKELIQLKKAYIFDKIGRGYNLSTNLNIAERKEVAHIINKTGALKKDEPMTHAMMILMIQIGIIIFAAKIGGDFFSKLLRMPAVLGEIIVGIIIGPQILGSIPVLNFTHGIFHAVHNFPVTPELYGIATIASIILLFLAGLETDLNLIMRFSVTGLMVGIGGVLISFVTGDLLAVFLSSMFTSETITFMHPTALFLGTISTATSVGITARILSERKKIDSPEGVSILAGAVIDDVLGVIILSVVLGISLVFQASGGNGTVNWGHIAIIGIKAVGFWVITTALGLMAASKLSYFLKKFNASIMAVMTLGLTLFVAGIFEMAGLAMIIGAYIIGVALSKTDINHELQEKLRILHNFFVPIFFTVMGMLIDFSALSSSSIIIFGVIYSLAAVFAKLVGSGIPSLFLGFNLRGALRIGIGMVPRGEVALIIAGIGLSAGIIDSSVFGIAIMMTLITTMLAPPALVAAFKNPVRGTKKTVSIKSEEMVDYRISFSNKNSSNLMLSTLIDFFQGDEFFVHLIDIGNNIYSIRKENIAVTIVQNGNNIDLTYSKKNSIYIKFMMAEATVELASMINEVENFSALQQKTKNILTS